MSVIFWPYNKLFFDQACSVTIARYWPRSFSAFLLISTLSRSIKTQKELGQYPAILTEQAWSIAHKSKFNNQFLRREFSYSRKFLSHLKTNYSTGIPSSGGSCTVENYKADLFFAN